jgi:hypothetical protein
VSEISKLAFMRSASMPKIVRSKKLRKVAKMMQNSA